MLGQSFGAPEALLTESWFIRASRAATTVTRSRSWCRAQLSLYLSSERDVRFEGLDIAFRKVVPDFVVASGSHID